MEYSALSTCCITGHLNVCKLLYKYGARNELAELAVFSYCLILLQWSTVNHQVLIGLRCGHQQTD
jgi:hypothetical protein